MNLQNTLKDAQSGLIDLSLANPLLNYKHSKKRGISFRVKNFSEFFRKINNDIDSEVALVFPGDEIDCNLSFPDFVSRSKYTKSEAKMFAEEKGVNVLFLAMGFISWCEDERSDIYSRSPLILVPVRLNVESDAAVSISRLDEDVQENFALIEKFSSLGIKFPRFNDEKGVDEFIASLQNLSTHPIVKSIDFYSAAIDIFRTQRYFMYQDLNPDLWDEEINAANGELPEFLDKMINKGIFGPTGPGMTEEEAESLGEGEEPLLVKDADLSQFKAIVNAREGKSFVIQGPPGTGKSQTITNLIADLVYQGKKILFVSEKSTALDVVRDNLSHVGLEKIILDLHDSDARKTSVLKNISDSIESAKTYSPNNDFTIEKYYQVRRELKSLRDVLNAIVGESGCRIEAILTNLEESYEYFRKQKISFSELDSYISSANTELNITSAEYQVNLNLIGQYISLSKRLDGDIRQVFNQIKVPRTEILDEVLLHRLIDKLDGCIGDYSGPALPANDGFLIQKLKQAEAVLDKNFLAQVINAKLGVNIVGDIDGLLNQLIRISKERNGYQGQIKNLAWLTNADELSVTINDARPRLHQVLSSDKKLKYNATKAQFFNEKLSDSRLSELIRAIRRFQSAFTAAINPQKGEFVYEQMIGSNVGSLDIDIYIQNLQALKSNIAQLIEVGLIEAINNADAVELEAGKAYLSLNHQESGVQDSNGVMSLLEDLAAALMVDVEILAQMPGSELRKLINMLPKALSMTYDWHLHSDLANSLNQKHLEWLLQQSICSAEALYKYAYFKNLQSQFDSSVTHLDIGTGISIEGKREEFRKLDLYRKEYCRDLILSNQSASVNQILSNPSQNFIALNKLFSRVRNIPSIRKVIQNCFEEISAIKPVFMMSPLSVAIFIPKKLNYFDYVIFDEASQIKPSDALGAILRAKNCIIVGDSKQLPPTRMFDADASGVDGYSSEFDVFDEESGDTGLADIASILEYADSMRMPSHRLNWHYRSKYSSLISVSNVEFYDSGLVTFPDFREPLENEGVRFTYVPNGNYERSTTRKNTNEAQIVVDAIFEHIRLSPSKSLGVATFSVAQKEAIEERLMQTQEQRDALDDFNRGHPKEQFFIKNIERIQGDERDCIFISIGYGKAVNSASDSINFGPLNQGGGDKRLNVLISRAKYLCRVFSSIHYYDIPTTNTSSLGVQKLKTFLKFAETGELDVPQITGGDYDSEFERSVANAIRSLGYSVDCQVGSSGFKVDLAVRDKTRVGEYICGVECDGATYHSSLTARERDRIRQEILESRGWKILRIWSTDWFKSKDRELEKIAVQLSKFSENSNAI